MLNCAQKVTFLRSNGKWSNGVVQKIEGEWVTVQWLSGDGKRVGTKCIHSRHIKPVRFSLKRIELFACVFGVLTHIILLLVLIDKYFILKQVTSL